MYKIYSTVVGAFKIHDPFLSNIRIKAIMREGVEYDIVYSSPSGRQAYHKLSTGEVSFETSFTLNEKIFILI